MLWKNHIQIFHLNFIWFIITFSKNCKTDAKEFPIGVIYDIENVEQYKSSIFAMKQLFSSKKEEQETNSSQLEFKFSPKAEYMSGSGNWCQTSDVLHKQICQNHVFALIPIILSDLHLIEFFTISHKFRVPVVAPMIPVHVSRRRILDYSIQPVTVQEAVLAMITHYGYDKFIYLYSGTEGMHRLQIYHDNLKNNEIVFAKRFTNTSEIITILHDIEKSSRWSFKFIVLDCPIKLAKAVLLSHVRDHSLGRRTFHYLIAGFAFDETWDTKDRVEISSLNVTGFRIINQSHSFVQEYERKWSADNFPNSYQPEYGLSTNAAFVHDAILVLKEWILQLSKKSDTIFTNIFYPYCNKTITLENSQNFSQNFDTLDTLHQELNNVKLEGLTGNIEFTEFGARVNFSLEVMEIKANGSLIKVGEWTDGFGYNAYGIQHVPEKTYICTTVLESPYIMLKEPKPGEPELYGNDRYEGFFKDIADELAEKLNISYTIQITTDYGSQNYSIPGGWSGMMGELVRNEADIAVGALTSNSAREKSVQLSKSVVFLGISIMMYKPERTWQQDVFAFMRPLSRETWMCIGLAYIGVSGVLFIIAKFNQKELHSTEKMGVVKLKPQFSISNSLWFTFASLVGQGTDICPRSISARLVGSVWWFLILIVTSSYTANFAAIQTVNRLDTPINSVSELAAQTYVKYGYLEGGATADFFKRTTVPDYQKMTEFIATNKGMNVHSVDEGIARVRREKGKYAFLLESLKNKYTCATSPCDTIKVGDNLDTKGYVIGLSKISGLNMHKINTIILEMRETGVVAGFEEKWMGSKNECGVTKKDKDAGRLSLDTLIGVFYILIMGLLVALIIQVFEFWHGTKKNSRSPKE